MAYKEAGKVDKLDNQSKAADDNHNVEVAGNIQSCEEGEVDKEDTEDLTPNYSELHTDEKVQEVSELHTDEKVQEVSELHTD